MKTECYYGFLRFPNFHNDFQTFHFYDRQVIDWVNGGPPIDEPVCGYRGQKCIQPKSKKINLSRDIDFKQCGMCDQQWLRPACAYAQTDQSPC